MAYANRYKSAQERSGVFISYARSDGEAFAHRLRQQLEKQNIRLWQDRLGMEGGRDWWLQIAEALDNVAFMALVVTPNALKSDIVRKEWRYARQQGVCVYPIKGAPNLNFESLPRWMRDQHFYDLGSLDDKNPGPEWRKFLNDLNKTPDIRRVPFMVEDLPAGFVVSASDDKTLRLWDAVSGSERLTFAGHTHWVTACDISPDGGIVVSASDDKTLKLWDAKTGDECAALSGHTDSITSCEFTPDGNYIVSASYDRTL